MKIIADTHCHTLASTHAYSTIEEMVRAARRVGLFAIAITDHARTMPGSPKEWYFGNLLVIPRIIDGVIILRGIEANVCDFNGNLDVDNFIIDRLDWVIASIHDITLNAPKKTEECTEAWLNVAKNPKVNVIGHSGLETFKYDYEKVIPEFGRNGKLVEINNTTFRLRSSSIPNCKKIAEICKKYEVPIVVNSDAHFSTEVANVDFAMELLEEINFPKELIVNANVDRFKMYLSKYTNVMEDSCITMNN